MNSRTIIRYTLYIIEILLALIVQVTPYLLPELFGGKAVLLVPLALSIAVFERDIPAMAFGVICGLLTDCSYSGPVGFYVIALVIACFVISNLYASYIRRTLLTVMLLAFAAIPLIFFGQFFFYYILAGYGELWRFFLRHYVARILCTLAWMPVFYGMNRWLNKKLGQKQKGV